MWSRKSLGDRCDEVGGFLKVRLKFKNSYSYDSTRSKTKVSHLYQVIWQTRWFNLNEQKITEILPDVPYSKYNQNLRTTPCKRSVTLLTNQRTNLRQQLAILFNQRVLKSIPIGIIPSTTNSRNIFNSAELPLQKQEQIISSLPYNRNSKQQP